MKKLLFSLLVYAFIALCIWTLFFVIPDHLIWHDTRVQLEKEALELKESQERNAIPWGPFEYPDDEKLILFLARLRESGEPLAETMAEIVERYESLGLPNISDMEFCHLPAGVFRNANGDGVSGNAWRISGTKLKDGRHTGLFVINGGEVVRVWGNKNWEKGRFKRRTLQIVKGLPFSQPEPRSNYNPGLVFLFALQLHQLDETVAAEVIVRQLCAVFGSDAVETAARNALSETLYRSAYWKFCETKDWQEFHANIQRAIDTGLESWWWMPSLREMSAQVKAIAFHGGTPLPEVYTFTSEEAVLIRELEAVSEHFLPPKIDTNVSQTLWLIPQTWNEVSLPFSPPERKIRAMGMKALPMLAALADEFPKQHYPMVIYTHGWRHILPFPHPALRSQKARKILLDMLPQSTLISKQYDDLKTPLHDVALAFYETHKDSSPEELAFQYLLRPDGKQNEIALKFINANYNEENHHEN